jgi:Domain of unknown function (DUF4062)
MGTPSVYISSTFEDLKEYRAAVFEALEKAGFPGGRMEGFCHKHNLAFGTLQRGLRKRRIEVEGQSESKRLVEVRMAGIH